MSITNVFNIMLMLISCGQEQINNHTDFSFQSPAREWKCKIYKQQLIIYSIFFKRMWQISSDFFLKLLIVIFVLSMARPLVTAFLKNSLPCFSATPPSHLKHGVDQDWIWDTPNRKVQRLKLPSFARVNAHERPCSFNQGLRQWHAS